MQTDNLAVHYISAKPQEDLPWRLRFMPVIRAFQQTQKGSLALHLPDGKTLEFSGERPGARAEMHVHNWKVFDRMATQGDIGWGEDYMAGLWDTPDIKILMQFMVENAESFTTFANGVPLFRVLQVMMRKIKLNSPQRSQKNVAAHYDLGNDFYSHWLDETMTYSCGLFHGDEQKPLEIAQRDKYDRILYRLGAQPASHILDIGCGWGGFMARAAEQGCHVTGLTLSPEQRTFAENRFGRAGIADRTRVRLMDYRAIKGRFDGIASIGMFEHVGEEYWQDYMKIIRHKLKPGKKAMVQTIIIRDDLFDGYRQGVDFIRAHIFPGGLLPSRARFEEEAGRAGLAVTDVFHFGRDYAITLDKWLERFDQKTEAVKALGHSDAFIRKWRFYMAGCAAMFRAGRIDVMQAELQ